VSNFALIAHGARFDVDEYVVSAPIFFDEVWRVGERHHLTSGVRKELGDGRPLSQPEQERIAIEYLAANREALAALARFPGVTAFLLGFDVVVEASEGLVGFAVCTSPRLMAHALAVGVEPTFYIRLAHPWSAGRDG
jgi:hypothetical protein